MKKILVTGALGQIGSELVVMLRELYGAVNVISNDIRKKYDCHDGPFAIVNVMDGERLFSVAKDYGVDTIIHLAALLSAKAESEPQKAWILNMDGVINALEVARELDLKFFAPSSIGSFGPTTPKDGTHQDDIQRPTTM